METTSIKLKTIALIPVIALQVYIENNGGVVQVAETWGKNVGTLIGLFIKFVLIPTCCAIAYITLTSVNYVIQTAPQIQVSQIKTVFANVKNSAFDKLKINNVE